MLPATGSQGVGHDFATELQYQLQCNYYEWYDFFLLFVSFTEVCQMGGKKSVLNSQQYLVQ